MPERGGPASSLVTSSELHTTARRAPRNRRTLLPVTSHAVAGPKKLYFQHMRPVLLFWGRISRELAGAC